MIRLPQCSTRTYTFVPYTTLFRSNRVRPPPGSGFRPAAGPVRVRRRFAGTSGFRSVGQGAGRNPRRAGAATIQHRAPARNRVPGAAAIMSGHAARQRPVFRMTTNRVQPEAADDAAAPATPRISDTDVLVIGGGPAGSTIATLLARKGWQVTQLEKDRHPRFHIGESLLPMNMPILKRMGAFEKVDAIGMLKLGADFPRDEGGYNTFDFARALDAKCDHAYHVKREQFDQVLFEHARENGVDAREQVKVERVEFGARGRPALVHAQGADGNALAFRPRYVVDASGRDAFLGGKLKLKDRKSTRLNSSH